MHVVLVGAEFEENLAVRYLRGIRPPLPKAERPGVSHGHQEVFMLEAFRNGGWGMFPTALFGVICLVVAARYALKPEARLVPLQLALGVVTVLSGCLGFVTGLIITTAHLHEVPENQVPLIGALGFGESLHNVALALILVVLAALCTSVGVVRAAPARACA